MFFFIDSLRFSISIWYKNPNMAILILHPILALMHCISALKPDGSRADIQWPHANIECDIKIAM